MRKFFKNICLVALYALCASCIYPYEMEVADAGRQLVMEGDIIVGGTTSVSVSFVQPLNQLAQRVPVGLAWVQDEDGKCWYPDFKNYTNKFTINTSTLPVSGKYSLHFLDSETGEEYASELSAVNKAPKIGNLYYTTTSTTVSIFVDVTSLDGEKHFRTDYYEVWEYVADFVKTLDFDVKTQQITELEYPDESLYYCWDEAASTDYSLISLEGKTSSYLPGNLVKTMNRSLRKLSSTYKIEVSIRGISADGYRYMDNLKKISSVQGSLFSPNPSEVKGNVTCLDNPDMPVRGFVNVCTVAKKSIYISNVYKRRGSIYADLFIPQTAPSEENPEPMTLLDYYNAGAVPVTFDELNGVTDYLWGPTRCIDCREYGGTKKRPEGWPTKNY